MLLVMLVGIIPNLHHLLLYDVLKSQPPAGDSLPLQEVHQDVIATPSMDKTPGDLDIPSMDTNASFKDFFSKLIKNGSDKGFMHQKKYQNMIEPIIEEQEGPNLDQQGEEDGLIDMVDYEGSDT
jgi:hypothetical protein